MELEIVTREYFVKYINEHKELDAKAYESNSVCSMMYIDNKGQTMAQAIYYKSGKPIYKVRRVNNYE